MESWGNNYNYKQNPCMKCTKTRIWKENGKYIRCDSDCIEHDKWKAWNEEIKAKKNLRLKTLDAMRELKDHRCTTRKRKAV